MDRKSVRIFAAAVILVATTWTLSPADSITLRSGKVVIGVVKQIDGGYDVTLEGGKHTFVPTADVKSLKLSNDGKVTEADARERLLSLQRSVEAERDIDRIIERYTQFIGMNANTAAAKQAQSDLDMWRDRKTKNMLKVGRRWLTVVERDTALVDAAKLVDHACVLITAGEIDEATKILREASDEDPENVSFAYLNGVLQLRREQFFEAKRSFDVVADRVPNHPPTLVNLAVLAAQFKRWPQAVSQLDQAMTLAPANQEILDNVFELQQLVPESTRRTAIYEKFAKRAGPLEAALEARQAQRGLFRLGSAWVDKAALDAAKAELDAYEKKKADLESQYQAAQETIRKAEEQIALIQRTLSRIEADSFIIDANGNTIRRGYPAAYYDLQRDLDLWQTQQRAGQDRIANLRKEADVVKKNAPKPPLAGKLQPIDQRGVPIFLPTPATQPTTRPASQPSTEPSTMPAATMVAEPISSSSTTVPSTATVATTMPSTAPTRGLFDE